MIRPGSRRPRGVDVLPSKEVRFDIQLLKPQFAAPGCFMDPLVARIKSPDMSTHCHNAGLFGQRDKRFGVFIRVSDRYFHQYMCSRSHDLRGLRKMHFGRRGQNDRVRSGQSRGQIAAKIWNGVFSRDHRCIVGVGALPTTQAGAQPGSQPPTPGSEPRPVMKALCA